MRTIAAAAVFLAVTMGAARAADGPSAAEAAQAVARYYPAKAKASGVEGEAVLHCERTVHAALKDCKLISESPDGYGFGETALALAKLSVENVEVTVDPATALEWGKRDIIFRFRANPLSITPNPLLPDVVLTNPIWTRLPTRAELAEAAKVAAPGAKGRVMIRCAVATGQELVLRRGADLIDHLARIFT